MVSTARCQHCGDERVCTMVSVPGQGARTRWLCEDCRLRESGVPATSPARRPQASFADRSGGTTPRAASVPCSMCGLGGAWDLITMPSPYSHLRARLCPSCLVAVEIARSRQDDDALASAAAVATSGSRDDLSVGRRVWSFLNQPVQVPVPPPDVAKKVWTYLNQPVRLR